ncbi:unnamed protein product [Prunus armeniaca]
MDSHRSSFSVPPDYITGTGVDNHAIEVRCKLHPFAKKNQDENVLPLFENTLVLGLHWFSSIPAEMAELFKNDAEAPLCFQSSSALASSVVLLENRHLAEALHNHIDVGVGPIILAHLFMNLHTATLENPLNMSAPGAFWMIQIWLQVYFPELRFPDIIMLEDQVLALPLILAEVPKRSIKEYLMLFRHCTKRPAAQWQIVIRRSYPWFQPGDRLLVKEPEEESARTNFRKKFLSVTLPRDLPHGGGKPPNYHLGAKSIIPTSMQGNLAAHSSFYSNPIGVAIMPLLGGTWMTWRCTKMPGEETHKFMVQTIKAINAQAIEDPSLTRDIGGQSVQAGEVIVTFVISDGDLELPFGDEEDETLAEEPPVEATPSARRKRKETAPAQDSAVMPDTSIESPPPAPTKSKRLRKRTLVEYVATEEPAAAPTTTSGTNAELRETFEAVDNFYLCISSVYDFCLLARGNPCRSDCRKHRLLAQRQQEVPRAELTSLELALFEDAKAEHSTAIPASEEQAEHSSSELVEQAELPVAVPKAGVEVAATVHDVVVEVLRATGVLVVITSPMKRPIVVMPIHSLPGSSVPLPMLI